MLALAVLLVLSNPAASPQIAGEYLAVTETEYAIQLNLAPSGQAQFEFRAWEPDDAGSEVAKTLKGTWSLSGTQVKVNLSGGKAATYESVACLPHREFGQLGCSPGLKLIKTNLPAHYGLQRFGLWRSDGLRTQP